MSFLADLSSADTFANSLPSYFLTKINVCCGCSKELSELDGCFEHPKCMF